MSTGPAVRATRARSTRDGKCPRYQRSPRAYSLSKKCGPLPSRCLGSSRADGNSGSTPGWASRSKKNEVVPARLAPIRRNSGSGRTAAVAAP